MNILLTLLFIAVSMLFVVIGVSLLVRKNNEEPEANRKWTDPKFHD